MLRARIGISTAAILIALVSNACATKPILNIENVPIATAKVLKQAQVRQAIITAAVSLGWQVADLRSGVLKGTLRLREHTAVVEIPYTNTQYSIVFKSGENLKSNDGSIHKNYNGWVQNLDRRIQTELSAL